MIGLKAIDITEIQNISTRIIILIGLKNQKNYLEIGWPGIFYVENSKLIQYPKQVRCDSEIPEG